MSGCGARRSSQSQTVTQPASLLSTRRQVPCYGEDSSSLAQPPVTLQAEDAVDLHPLSQDQLLSVSNTAASSPPGMAGDGMDSNNGSNGAERPSEMDMDEMQMAIQALSSLKGTAAGTSGGSNGSPSIRPRPSEITLPPISTFLNGPPGAANGHANGHPASRHHHHHHHHPHEGRGGGGLQYSYVSAAGGRYGVDANGHRTDDMHGASSSASTSAYTYSAVTTPSGRTTTSLSSPGSPIDFDNSAYFGLDDDHAQFDLPEGANYRGMVVRQQAQQVPAAEDDGFIGRVSQLPLVSGALRVYERGRNSSRVVKVSPRSSWF